MIKFDTLRGKAWIVTRWFTRGWWAYLMTDCRGVENFWCRVRGHDGVVWFNPGGMEPDMHCVRCGEDLG